MYRYIILIVAVTFFNQSCKVRTVSGQSVSIKDFGAKGNGVTNDHQAFEEAANYINRRKGNVTLRIPSGTYLIGKQIRDYSGKNYLIGKDALALYNCKNVKIIGGSKVILKYRNGLKYGTFNPQTGKVYRHKMPFKDRRYTAQIGHAILLSDCRNIQVINIEVDGNSQNLKLGGRFGDKGTQLSHYGAQIVRSKTILFKGCNFHHLALDGIKVTNTGINNDNIELIDSKFNYNGRQGLSWIGGNGLRAMNCDFSHTGKGGISSSPAAGVDIEASGKFIIRNGSFINCHLVNNNGCGMVADMGPSSNVSFSGCTFWGVSSWSIWVKKPNFTFKNCNIYGSFVHGYITDRMDEATKFYECQFEDKPYQSKGPYGGFLLECDKQKLMIFEDCSFTSNKKKTIWYNGRASQPNAKAQFTGCTFNVRNRNLKQGDYFGIIRRAKLDNVEFNYFFPKEKKYYLGQNGNEASRIKANYKSR